MKIKTTKGIAGIIQKTFKNLIPKFPVTCVIMGSSALILKNRKNEILPNLWKRENTIKQPWSMCGLYKKKF